jgi:uroporphyrinogen decarboxylase
MTTIDDVEAHPFAGPDDLDVTRFVEHVAAHQDFAVCGGINSAIFHNYLGMCGQENALCLLKTDPELAESMIRRITDYWEGYLRKLLEAGRGMVDMVENCNDFGTQRSMFISVEDFRAFFREPLTRLYNTAKEYGVLYMQHSCGSIAPIIDDFIEMGADILNPIQVEADGMDLDELVERYKGKITFYGGIDTQHLLPHGPEEAIRDEVRRLKGLFGNAGGLIMAGSQGLLDDIPYANAIAMLDENRK